MCFCNNLENPPPNRQVIPNSLENAKPTKPDVDRTSIINQRKEAKRKRQLIKAERRAQRQNRSQGNEYLHTKE